LLSYINLKNFKCFQDVKLPLSSINVFIGQNGTGKSTISQSIALLKQSDEGEIKFDGSLINLGKFSEVKNNRSKRDNIAIQFGGTLSSTTNVKTILGILKIEYGFHVGFDMHGFQEIGYKIDSESPWNFSGTLRKKSSPSKTEKIDYSGMDFSIRTMPDLRNFIQFGGGNPYDKHDDFEKVSSALSEILSSYKKQLELCHFIPSTRGFDQASYQLLDFVTRIESSRGVTKQAEMAVTKMAHDYKIPEKINHYITKVLPDTEIQIRNLPQQRLAIVNKDQFGEYKIINEGFGLNQSIYLFMELAISAPNSTLFIDEPEISLHPASQSKLSSVLVDVCQNENHQMVITTHSEHILLGIIERIMELKLDPRILKVYYFEKEKGISKVTPLPLNEKGELEGGMKGFFEEDLGHIDKFIERMKKKK